jgi:hypothetical protein
VADRNGDGLAGPASKDCVDYSGRKFLEFLVEPPGAGRNIPFCELGFARCFDWSCSAKRAKGVSLYRDI